jgi:penicillin-binding protein 1A
MSQILKNQYPKKNRRKTQKKEDRQFFKWRVIGKFFLFLAILPIGSAGALMAYYTYSGGLSAVENLKNFQPSTITLMYSDQDELIAEFYVEKRIVVPLKEIPLRLKQATLAVEDANFYYHLGIDPKAIFRAFVTNLKAGQVVEGGSTITQQLSKTLFLSRERTLIRKIKELILSVHMEMIFTKDEILEMYLNQIYYGHGSYGVEAAARTYFGKHVGDLTLDECALIAALPKAPNNYSPYRNPERATSRRSHVLQRMAQERFINHQEAHEAMNKDFQLGEITNMLNKAPYFVEHIRQFLMATYDRNKVYRDGLKVFTTLNLKKQMVAERSIRKNLRVSDKRYGYRGSLGTMDLSLPESDLQQALRKINRFDEGAGLKIGTIVKGLVQTIADDHVTVLLGEGEGIIELKDMKWARKPNTKVDGRWTKIDHPNEALAPGDQIMVKILGVRNSGFRWSLALEQEPEVEAALISLEPETGHIKAMVGGYDFSKSQFNRAVQAVRQPGSVFKPIIYATAINEGFSPASIIIDSPIIFKEKDHAFEKWKPVNFEKIFYGPTPLRTALAHSRNIVTVKLLQQVGIHSAIQMARNLGISSHLESNLSIALGSSGVTLYELASAYSTFANQGTRVEPQGIRYIINRDGETLFTGRRVESQPLSSGVAYMVTNLLQSVIEEGTAKKIQSLKRAAAGKTGTTDNYKDAWFMGYTPELLTGVWVGKDKGEPLGVNETGSRTAIPIWLQYMRKVLAGAPIQNFPVSEEIVFTKINPKSGKLTNSDDPEGRFEVFLTNQLPEEHLDSEEIKVGNTF